MKLLVASSLAVLALAAAAPRTVQAQCTDEAAVRATVEAACPCSETKTKKYQKCVAKALRDNSVEKKCAKEIKRIFNASLCGKPSGAVICCQVRNKKIGSVKKKEKQCKTNKGAVICGDASRSSVAGAFFNSVDDVCSTAGECNPTPTTTTTTTTTIPTTTTTTLVASCDVPGSSVEFVTGPPVGNCGSFQNGSDAEIGVLNCGGLNLGGGNSTVLEGPTPDGAANRFKADCTGNTCTLSATETQSACWDCTTTGCNFGTPLPILNGGLSTCVLNTFAAPATGTLDTSTGVTTDLSIDLNSQVFLSGLERYQNGGGPCPVCSEAVGGPAISGTPENPATGVCDGGPSAGQPCTTTNSEGLSRDCKPGGVTAEAPCDPAGNTTCADGTSNLGSIPVDLTPLSTGSLEQTADGSGNFCPDQRSPGCFGRANSAVGTTCRKILTAGSAGGAMTANTPVPITLASIFCIPNTSSDLINLSADIAGPGQTSLVGTLELIESP